MKISLLVITIGFLGLLPASDSFAAEKFVVVGVAGFKTMKPTDQATNILSSEHCQTCDPSGAWTNLPRIGARIHQRVFLAHSATLKELDAVIGLFQNRNQVCNKNLGMIIMANSWGAAVANRLAKRFQATCDKRVEFFVLVDGILKPTTLSYRSSLAAKSCLNIYQRVSTLHGGPIANCENIDLMEGQPKTGGLYEGHLEIEWRGTELGARAIEDILN